MATQEFISNENVMGLIHELRTQVAHLSAARAAETVTHHVTYDVTVKPRKPSFFYGHPTDLNVLSAWIFDVERYFGLSHIADDMERIIIASSYLKKSADIWWRQYSMSVNQGIAAPITTWEDFKNKLEREFAPKDGIVSIRDKLWELVLKAYKMEVNSYISEFRKLTVQLPHMTEEEKIYDFTRGLRFRTKAEVECRQPGDLNEAMYIAVRYEASFERRNKGLRRYHDDRRGVPHVDGTKPEKGKDEDPMDLDDLEIRKTQRREERKRRGACFICGSTEHWKRDCPKLKNKANFRATH